MRVLGRIVGRRFAARCHLCVNSSLSRDEPGSYREEVGIVDLRDEPSNAREHTREVARGHPQPDAVPERVAVRADQVDDPALVVQLSRVARVAGELGMRLTRQKPPRRIVLRSDPNAARALPALPRP